jgi:glyoxylase-like metal-dependent hydrolase (beta-lactamase superfamily II)
MGTVAETDTLTRISRLGFVNCFLVREDDGLTLVDTMLKGSQKRILAAAEAAGAPIVRIVLTHYHDDHSGSLDALAEALPGAEVMWSGRETRILRDKDTSLEAGEPEAGKVRPIKPLSAQPARELNGGDRVGSLEVVSSPGHSPGHLAFLDTRDRTLIAGDAYATLGGAVATTAKPYWRFPLPGFITWNGEVELESAKALRALEPTRLAVGHGKTVADPLSAMDAAIARGS